MRLYDTKPIPRPDLLAAWLGRAICVTAIYLGLVLVTERNQLRDRAKLYDSVCKKNPQLEWCDTDRLHRKMMRDVAAGK